MSAAQQPRRSSATVSPPFTTTLADTRNKASARGPPQPWSPSAGRRKIPRAVPFRRRLLGALLQSLVARSAPHEEADVSLLLLRDASPHEMLRCVCGEDASLRRSSSGRCSPRLSNTQAHSMQGGRVRVSLHRLHAASSISTANSKSVFMTFTALLAESEVVRHGLPCSSSARCRSTPR